MRGVVVIPAYNEERTVGSIVKAARGCPWVSDVIVVSDGSTDQTPEVAAQEGAKVINLQQNRGKGGAMAAGLQLASAEIIVFLDADLVGLTSEHVSQLMRPVVSGEAEVSVGLFGNGRLSTDLAQKIAPFLSGQRAITQRLINLIPDFSETGWGVEVALTKYIKENDISVAEVILDDVTQIMKEEKVGLLKGFASRMRMYWHIVKVFGQGNGVASRRD